MEKIIWVIADNRTDMLEAQRSINSRGSMRAICILSFEALQRMLTSATNMPSLIMIDYDMSVKEEFKSLSLVKEQQRLVGIPLFFMAGNSDDEVQNDCYMRGALVVVSKPLNAVAVERMERMAWQFDVARNAEKKLEKQAYDLKAAREIERLNKQLEARNELLYQVFGRYFSDEIMERIFQDPTGVSIGGEKKNMTVMMADLRGFTAVSQNMDSDSVMDLLNFYFGKMIEIISAYKGTVIEFLGDGILAVFGAPIPLEEHTESAVAAAITMQNAMSEVNAYCRQKGYETVDMGIGIHCGEVFIGNIGSEKVMRYNVIGSVVNECSRIEGYSVGSQVLVSSRATENMSCSFGIKDTIHIKAKGIGTILKVYEITELSGQYACRLHTDETQQAYNLSGEIVFELYLIIDKLLSQRVIKTTLKEITCKNAIVGLNDRITDFYLYDDVKIVARGPEGEILFDDVYAKIIDAGTDRLKLHFTHTDKGFRRLMEQIMHKEREA